MDAILDPNQGFPRDWTPLIGPAAEQKVNSADWARVLPQNGDRASCCFGQEMAEMVEIKAGEKDDRKLMFQRPNGISDEVLDNQTAGPMLARFRRND